MKTIPSVTWFRPPRLIVRLLSSVSRASFRLQLLYYSVINNGEPDGLLSLLFISFLGNSFDLILSFLIEISSLLLLFFWLSCFDFVCNYIIWLFDDLTTNGTAFYDSYHHYAAVFSLDVSAHRVLVFKRFLFWADSNGWLPVCFFEDKYCSVVQKCLVPFSTFVS